MRPSLLLVLLTTLSAAVFATGNDDAPSPAYVAEYGAGTQQSGWTIRGLDQPYAALYDSSDDVVYVSSIQGDPAERDGKGYISRIDSDGLPMEKHWIRGLDAPKGMAVRGELLYVADINELVVVDIAEAQVSNRYLIPGARMLQDVAVAQDGSIYTVDSASGTIHRVHDGRFEIWSSDSQIREPRAIAPLGEKLLLSTLGEDAATGRLITVSPDGQVTALPTDFTGRLSGLHSDGKGGFVGADETSLKWVRVHATGDVEILGELDPDTDYVADVPSASLIIEVKGEQNTVRAVPAP